MESKKGQTKFIVYVILALVSMVVILALISTSMKGCEKAYPDIVKCHDELFANDLIFKKMAEIIPVVGGTVKTKKQWPESCKTIGPVTIQARTKDEAMRILAENMTTCFWALGESAKAFDAFSENYVFSGERCHICYMVKIEGIEESINGEGFNTWLFMNHLQGNLDKQTYWNYLRGGFQKGVAKKLPVVLSDIEPGNYYAILYQDKVEGASDFPEGYQTDVVFLMDFSTAQNSKNCGKFKKVYKW